MDKTIAECDLAALLKFTSEIDGKNKNVFNSLESELSSTRKQYNKVVEQNKNLQQELKLANLKLNLIKDLLEKQNVIEPTTAWLKENINRVMELSE